MRTFLLIIVGLCLIGLLITFNFQLYNISGNFMAPTFQSVDTLLFKKYFLVTPAPKIGDIIIYKSSENPSVDFVGRVIAMPLEEIRVQNGSIYKQTNEIVQMEEKYLSPGARTSAVPEGQWIQLDASQYLVASDNRSQNLIDLQEDLVNKNQIRGVFLYRF